ncbi:MAG: class I SAM-dependent methyltransferase [Tepidisphaeraceae bacterium]
MPPSRPKSTPEQIRQRFDNDVERFSNLETGQSATIDAPLVLDLITAAAATSNPAARDVLDVGCGAGNYTLKLLEKLPNLAGITLIDLSRPMLDRATQRIAALTKAPITPLQGDVRDLHLRDDSSDVIVAAAVLHHLREEAQWERVFARFHRALRPGGSVWVSDLVSHELPAVQAMMWARYGDYLADLKDEKYRDDVFAYIDQEDSPRPLTWQLDLLRKVGFARTEVLHKNSCFAAFGAVK